MGPFAKHEPQSMHGCRTVLTTSRFLHSLYSSKNVSQAARS